MIPLGMPFIRVYAEERREQEESGLESQDISKRERSAGKVEAFAEIVNAAVSEEGSEERKAKRDAAHA